MSHDLLAFRPTRMTRKSRGLARRLMQRPAHRAARLKCGFEYCATPKLSQSVRMSGVFCVWPGILGGDE